MAAPSVTAVSTATRLHGRCSLTPSLIRAVKNGRVCYCGWTLVPPDRHSDALWHAWMSREQAAERLPRGVRPPNELEKVGSIFSVRRSRFRAYR